MFLRKPERVELEKVNVIRESRNRGYRLLLLSEDKSYEVDIERNRRYEIDRKVDRLEILKKSKLPGMPERPKCAAIPPEDNCRPKVFEPLEEDFLSVIRETLRRRADYNEYATAMLFEAEEGYVLITSLRADRQYRSADYLEAEGLIGISVVTEIRSFKADEGIVVSLPDLEPLYELEPLEAIGFTDDEEEAIVVTEEGLYIYKIGKLAP